MQHRSFMLLFVAAAAVLVASSTAYAIQIGASVGTGFSVVDSDISRLPFTLEVRPSMGLGPIHADLGLKLDIENTASFQAIPGVRLGLVVLYLRAGIPIQLYDGFDWGFLFAVGKDLLSLPLVDIFVEVGTSLMHSSDFSTFPVEFRIGVALGF